MAEVAVLDEFEEILLRLDAEDLLRCKSVCKSWYSFISSPYFVKAHLKHNINNPELGHFRVQLHWDRSRMPNLVGSSNGLVCISPYLAQFLVTNPSTREAKELQALPYRDRSKLCWGFGYDSSTDDYKLVVGANQDNNHHILFQVLTLKSNQWRFLGELNYHFYCRHGPGFLYSGALHWFMDDPNNSMNKVILSFDLSLEKFKEIPQPDDTKYVCDYRTELGTFEGCLCIFRTGVLIDDTYLPTWVMKNYNVKQSSWERLPYDYEKNELVAATPAYMVDYDMVGYDIYCNSWRLCDDDKGNIDLSWRCWGNIGAPIFVKSLISPYLCGKPEKKNNKNLKLDFSCNSKHTVLNKKRKRHTKNNKRNRKLIEGDPQPSA